MGRSAPFEPVLSSKALAFMLTLGKRRQKQLANLLFKLADYPYQPGDYESCDDCGRTIQHLRAGNLAISYWPDDSCRELRIVEIEEL
jgi:hypothetical protein